MGVLQDKIILRLFHKMGAIDELIKLDDKRTYTNQDVRDILQEIYTGYNSDCKEVVEKETVLSIIESYMNVSKEGSLERQRLFSIKRQIENS